MTTRTQCECLKCGYKWTPRLDRPNKCPRCITKYWDKPGRGNGVIKERAEKDTPPDENWTKVYRDISGTVTHIAWDLIDHRTNLMIPDRRVWIGDYENDSKAEEERKAESEGDTLQGLRDRIRTKGQTPEIP